MDVINAFGKSVTTEKNKEMGGSDFDPDEESRRPNDKAFFQQGLSGWQPVMTAEWGALTFLVMAAVCLPLGIALLVASEDLTEVVVHYGRDCRHSGGGSCEDFLKDNVGATCICALDFSVPNDIPGDVYMYYGIKKYHQNHRYYHSSKDYWQLLGRSRDNRKPEDNIADKCLPYRWVNTTSPFSVAYAPCGLIANSLFNDSLRLLSGGVSVDLNRRGIAWNTDSQDLFKNPPIPEGGNLTDAFINTAKPPNWQKEVWQLDTTDDSNNGYQNEDFIVWMRQAMFPDFRKLYGRIIRQGDFTDGLPQGNYTLSVDFAYPTWMHEGDKTVILTNLSWAGGKNNFLGILYIVSSAVFGGLAVLFFITWLYTRNWDKELKRLDEKARNTVTNPAFQIEDKEEPELTADAWRRRISLKKQPTANGKPDSTQGSMDLEKRIDEEDLAYNAQGVLSVWM